jgi:hypothetical protein
MAEEVTPQLGTEIVPSEAPSDLIGWAAEELAARIEWVRSEIADKCYQPAPSGAWAGRGDLINAIIDKTWNLTLIQAAQLVDAAVAADFAFDRPDDSAAQKQYSLMRLKGIRNLILKAMKEGRKEITYKMEERNGTIVRIPFKEKVYKGIDMAAIAQLRETERAIQELLGLTETKNLTQHNTLQIIMEQSRKKDEGKGKKGSMAAEAKNRPPEELLEDPGAQERMLAAISEIEARPVKKVKSKVKKKKQEESEEEEADE